MTRTVCQCISTKKKKKISVYCLYSLNSQISRNQGQFAHYLCLSHSKCHIKIPCGEKNLIWSGKSVVALVLGKQTLSELMGMCNRIFLALNCIIN